VIGGINVDPVTGQVADEMFDLNVMFETSLIALNEGNDDPWRIGFGRSVTDEGLVALQLIPDSAPYLLEDGTVPCILAVADLSRRLEPDAIMLIPINTSGHNDHLQLTPDGNVLVLETDPGVPVMNVRSRVFPLAINANGELGYFSENEMLVPTVHYGGRPGIQDSPSGEFFPEFTYTRSFDVSRKTRVSQVVKYTFEYTFPDESGEAVPVSTETILHEWENTTFFGEGFGTGGTAYGGTLEQETIGKGNNVEYINYWTPYHLLSPTARTPLTDPLVSARVWIRSWGISDASLPGEEEVVIQLVNEGELQVYKPNFNARFTLPIEPGDYRRVEISSPVDPLAITSDSLLGAEDYAAGYVGYGTDAEPDQVFILTPTGALLPGTSVPAE
jgi:hypothetical protein